MSWRQGRSRDRKVENDKSAKGENVISSIGIVFSITSSYNLGPKSLKIGLFVHLTVNFRVPASDLGSGFVF